MGFKSELFVKTVDENLFCSICFEVFTDPVSCKDGHTFCSECIEKWLKTSNKCPLDNNVITDNKLARNYIVSGIINNLEVYCQFSRQDGNKNNDNSDTSGDGVKKRCSWTGKLEELEKHKETCLFQLVPCTYRHCNVSVQRRERANHMKTCGYKLVVCVKCRVTLLRNDLKVHLENYCPKTMVRCPKACIAQDGKITEVMRMDTENHLATVCGKVLVDCPFKDQGCLMQVERQDVEKHVQENTAAHMMLLAKENKQLKDELNHVKEVLRKSKGSYVWKIDYFKSILRGESPVFLQCGHRWKLFVYTAQTVSPRIDHAEGMITCYLTWLGDIDGSKTEETNIPTFVRLSVLSTNPKDPDYTVSKSHSFTKMNDSLEFRDFMRRNDAVLPAYLEEESLNVHCTIQICYSE